MQIFDIIFLLVGITRNSLINVFPQIFSRFVIAGACFPLVPEGHWAIYLAVICWCFAEIIRFSFYIVKELEVCVYTSFLGRMIATARYNLFILNYPLGVSGELIAIYQAWTTMEAMKQRGEPMPFSIEMPNALNAAFDMRIFAMLTPIPYLIGFPSLYGHMVKQRANYNVKCGEEMRKLVYSVPDEYKTFKGIKNVLHIPVSKGKLTNAAIASEVKHTKGTVMLVDFWATWCPPC